MIKVRKEEAEYVRQHAKNARVIVSGRKKKSRNKQWYIDESYEALKYLQEFLTRRPHKKSAEK